MPEKNKKVGPYQAKNQADYEYRMKAYQDSTSSAKASDILNAQAKALTYAVINNKLTPDQADQALKKKKNQFLQQYGKKVTGIDPLGMLTYTAERADGKIAGRYTAPVNKYPEQEILPPKNIKSSIKKEVATAEQKAAAKARITGENRGTITALNNDIPFKAKFIPESKYDTSTINTLPVQPVPTNAYFADPTFVNEYKPQANYNPYTSVNNSNIELNNASGKSNKRFVTPGAIGSVTIPNQNNMKGYRKEIYNEDELSNYNLMQYALGGGLFLPTKKVKKYKAFGGDMQPGVEAPGMEDSISTEGGETTGQGEAETNRPDSPNKMKNFKVADFNFNTAPVNIQQSGDKMFDYYNKILEQDSKRNKNIAKGVIGLAGTALSPFTGGVSSMAAGTINNMFAEGGDMTYKFNSPISKQMDFGTKRNPVNNTFGNSISGALTPFTSDISPTAFGAIGSMFAMGGSLSEIPEQAGTHENNPLGGVPIMNYESSVEGGEVIDDKKRVFSNRLGNGGKTYGKQMKDLKRLTKLRPVDKYTNDFIYGNNVIEGKANELYADQEAQKELLNINNEIQNQAAYGGSLKKMWDGGGLLPKKETLTEKRKNQRNQIIGTPELDLGMTPKTTFDDNGNIKSISYFNPSLYKTFKPELIDEDLNNIYRTNQSKPKELASKKKIDWKKGIPYTQLLGPASQMLTSLINTNKDLANLNYRYPEYIPVDEFYASKIAGAKANQVLGATKSGIRANANTQGNYLQNLQGAEANMLAQGAPGAELAYQANVANVAGRNQAEAGKAATINRNIDEREKLLDNAREERTNALYNAGRINSGLYKDYDMAKQVDLNNQIYPNIINEILKYNVWDGTKLVPKI